LIQWVKSVISFSTQYGTTSWAANQVIGKPDTYPQYGDKSTAWAPSAATGTLEFLELKFETPVFITGVGIFETLNPGYVVEILAHDGNSYATLWSGQVHKDTPQVSRIFQPKFDQSSFKSNRIRINLDCREAVSWTEIDAVKLYGRT